MSENKPLEEFTTTYRKLHPDATDEDIKVAWDGKQFALSYKKENPKATDKDIKVAWDESQIEGLNLTDKVVKVMDEYGKMLMAQMKASLVKQMDEVVKATQDELVAAIRKGVGLEEDPVIHLSEVNALVRKMLLEKDEGKKTEDGEGGGPDGDESDDPRKFDIAKSFNELTNNRGGT